MKKYIIDRIEGEFAVLEGEDGSLLDIDKTLIPGCSEGDGVIFENGEYRIDMALTMERKKRIEEKMKKLFGEKH